MAFWACIHLRNHQLGTISGIDFWRNKRVGWCWPFRRPHPISVNLSTENISESGPSSLLIFVTFAIIFFPGRHIYSKRIIFKPAMKGCLWEFEGLPKVPPTEITRVTMGRSLILGHSSTPDVMRTSSLQLPLRNRKENNSWSKINGKGWWPIHYNYTVKQDFTTSWDILSTSVWVCFEELRCQSFNP